MWIRESELLAGDLQFLSNSFDFDFNIPFSSNKEPDVAEINIFNLTNSTINQITKQKYIILNAGYKDINNKGTILNGHIEDIHTSWVGVDKITTIMAVDGGGHARTATINKTYRKGTKASFIMRDLAAIMGYEIVEIEPVDDIVFKLGKTVAGRADKILNDLVSITNSKKIISNNAITIRDGNKGKNIGFVLNSNSGLIGTPERQVEKDDKGIKKITYGLQMLLNPLIRVDSIIKVESRTINGNYRVIEGIHNRDFNTEVKVRGV